LLAYLLSRRPRAALLVAGAGFALATLAVAPARPLAALIEPALLALAIARLPALRRTYRARMAAGDDAHQALGAALARMLGSRALGHALALELTLLRLAFAGWFLEPPRDGFFVARRQWAVVLVLLAFLGGVETFGLHLMLLHVSRPLAWIATVLAIYSLLWLLGDFQALRLLPTLIVDGELRVRVGLRSRARVPLDAITSVVRAESFPADGCLRATALGAPNVVVYARGVAEGLFGRRREFSSIAFAVTDPDAFVAALSPSS
jgi:hypothetical protein